MDLDDVQDRTDLYRELKEQILNASTGQIAGYSAYRSKELQR